MRDKYLDLAKELKRQMNMRVTVIPTAVGVLRTVSKGLEKKSGVIENQRENQDYPDYSIV